MAEDEAHVIVKAAVEESATRQYMLACLDRIPHAGNRLWMARYLAHLVAKPDGRRRQL
jgi:hypothetical protein